MGQHEHPVAGGELDARVRQEPVEVAPDPPPSRPPSRWSAASKRASERERPAQPRQVVHVDQPLVVAVRKGGARRARRVCV